MVTKVKLNNEIGACRGMALRKSQNPGTWETEAGGLKVLQSWVIYKSLLKQKEKKKKKN